MKKVFLRFHYFVVNQPYLIQVVVLYLLAYLFVLISIPVQMIAVELAGYENAGPDKSHLFLALVIAPVVETLVFQHWVFKVSERVKWGHRKYLWIMFVSAVLFGVTHFYSLRYIVFTIAIGFALAYTYYIFKSNTAKAFWTTALIHFLINLTVAATIYI